jgi:hypothetical protein
MEGKNLMEIRKLEITGMLMYAAAFGWYGYANLSYGIGAPHQPIVFPILSEGIVITLVVACLVRALALSSQITALAVTRVHRVKQIKERIREELSDKDS